MMHTIKMISKIYLTKNIYLSISKYKTDIHPHKGVGETSVHTHASHLVLVTLFMLHHNITK